MSQATQRVAAQTTMYENTSVYRGLVSGAAFYYPGAMISLDTNRYAVKAADTAGQIFDGVVANTQRVEVLSTDSSGDTKILVGKPWRFVMAIASAVQADIGKAVYVVDDQTVGYSSSNSILVGWVDRVLDSTHVEIRPTWVGTNSPATFDGNTLTFSGATSINVIVMPDNLADALSVKEGSNSYLTFVTTNSAEQINVKKPLGFPGTTGTNLIYLTDNLASALDITESTNSYLKFTSTNSAETVTITPLLTLVAGISFTGATTANVMTLTDNLADALNFKESSNSYLKFITTNAAEAVVFGKAITQSVGGSTAAAGSVTGDATALPSGTAFVYPTTGADDTKGVIIATADKVTGRSFFVGNGVSNKILKIYPPSGGTINGAAGDAAYSTASGKGAFIHCLSGAGNTWLAMG